MIEIIHNLRYVPHAGDPTLMGWLTVAVYLVAALLSAKCSWQAHRERLSIVHQMLWGFLGIAMLFLGINKQLDLQSLFTQIGREIAYRQGWFEMRQSVQNWTVAGMAGTSFVIVLSLAWVLRHFWKYYWSLLVGLLFLARYAVVRAATFWGVPLPHLSRFIGGFHINWLMEILGAALICLSAWSFSRFTHRQAEQALPTSV